jgi:UDP-MurNAc hydroxylase
MKIEFITNASFLMTAKSGQTLLTDPWYHDGAGHGILFNFPPLKDDQRQRYLSLKPSYIYVSHLHDDHLDPKALRHYDKSTPVLIGELNYKHLYNAIKAIGFTNIVECPLDAHVKLDGFSVVINDQFEGSSDGHLDETEYTLDTSIIVQDETSTVYFAVDNPIKLEDARKLKERFPDITTAILPYSGASPYPHVFSRYSYEEKVRRRESIKTTKLSKFCELSEIFAPKWAVPAAGSFVIGGKAASVSEFGHQPTPSEVERYWCANYNGDSGLCVMRTGDVLDMDTDERINAIATDFHEFTHDDRVKYALSTRDFASPFDEIHFPSEFRIPWRRLSNLARRNLWEAQQTLNTSLDIDVIFEILPSSSLLLGNDNAFEFVFSLNSEKTGERANSDFIKFKMEATIYFSILMGSVVWGNIEYLVEMDREPDVFNPTVHTLMAFFRL